MKNKKLSIKARAIIFAIAVMGGIGLNGYRQINETGHLDSLWFIAGVIAILVASGIFILIVLKEKDYEARKK